MKILKHRTFCDIAFLLALIFKIASYGPRYFPVLDDYIQYGGYPLYENVSHVYLNIGTIAARPFASLLDPIVWGSFYPDLFFALCLVMLLFFMGAKFIAKAFERMGIFITPFLYTFLLLCPLGFEGTYWLSASSRICVGLFFTGLSLHFLAKAIDKKRKSFMIPYALSTLLSFGFYESVMIVSFVLQFAFIVSVTKSNKKRFVYMLVPVICGILMIVYYKLAQNLGALGSRASTFSIINLDGKISSFITQFAQILINGGIKTIFIGAYEGIKLMILSYAGLVRLILAFVISGLCAYFGAKEEFHAKTLPCLILGVACVFLPLVPNLLTGEVWLTYRNIVPCFIGLVLVSAPIFNKILARKKVRIATLFMIILIFMCANVNELDTYRRVNYADNALVNEICTKLDDDVIEGKKEALVVLKNEPYIPQVSFYKDHVKSVFSSDWALTGAVRAKCKNVKIKMLTPVYSLYEADTKGKQIIYTGGNYE